MRAPPDQSLAAPDATGSERFLLRCSGTAGARPLPRRPGPDLRDIRRLHQIGGHLLLYAAAALLGFWTGVALASLLWMIF